MREESERLMRLLRGQTVEKPPFWEPWFMHMKLLKERYGGEFLSMASDLGHAAMAIGSAEVGSWWQNESHTDQMWYGGGALAGPEQLAARPEPDYESQIENLSATNRKAHDAGIATWLVIGWCFDRIAGSMGLGEFALACYDRPEFIHQAMQWVERRNTEAVHRIVAKVKPDFVLYNGDCAYKSSTMIAPEMIREFCFEPTKKTAHAIAELGIPLAFHTDGKLDDVVPILVELGIAAVHGCEKQANDLGYLVDRFGDDIALCGNMDVVFLTHATPAQVHEETLKMLREGSRKRRFIAACNTSPSDYIPIENYVAFCKTVRDWNPGI